MDLTQLLLLIILIIVKDASAQTCNMNPLVAGTSISVPTSVPTFTVSAPTINIGPIPSPAPSPYPTVLINGINPLGWSAYNFTPVGAPSPTASCASTSGMNTVALSATNLNPRAPSPAPSTFAYTATCSSVATFPPTPTSYIKATATNDCIVFPQKGYYKVTFNVYVSVPAPTGSNFYFSFASVANSLIPNGGNWYGYLIHDDIYSAGANLRRTFFQTIKIDDTTTPGANIYTLALGGGSTSTCLVNRPHYLLIESLGPL